MVKGVLTTVRRIKAKLVHGLRDQELSRNAIAMDYCMSKHSVINVFDAADVLGVSCRDMEKRSDDERYAMLFPGRSMVESVYGQPDWGVPIFLSTFVWGWFWIPPGCNGHASPRPGGRRCSSPLPVPVAQAARACSW